MSKEQKLFDIKKAIVSYPDFPKKGIVFRDFLPILQCPKLMDSMLSLFEDLIKEYAKDVQYIIGLESRGFLIGASLALKQGIPFIPIRKPGKLPGNVRKEIYSLEYGEDALEIQVDAVREGGKVVIVDDLLATGGTMQAAVKLVESVGGSVESCIVVIELTELQGRNKITAPMHSLMQF